MHSGIAATGGSRGSMNRGPRAPGAPSQVTKILNKKIIGILLKKNYAGVQKRIIDHSPVSYVVIGIYHKKIFL